MQSFNISLVVLLVSILSPSRRHRTHFSKSLVTRGKCGATTERASLDVDAIILIAENFVLTKTQLVRNCFVRDFMSDPPANLLRSLLARRFPEGR